MIKSLLSLAALVVVLMSNVYVVFADPEILPLLWKYEEDGLTYERLCKPGKLVIMSNSKNSPNYGYDYNYLIDLTDGRIVYKSDPNKDLGVYTNYFGDRYYVVSIDGLKVKEYDVKTNEFIREVFGPVSAPDSSLFSYNSFNHSLIFKNAITGFVLDSFKIPNTPNQPYYLLGTDGFRFSNDSKYFTFSLITNEKPYTKRFYLYDRVNREIIFEKSVEPYYVNFRYSFFNKTNKMAYAEQVQLPGDDTVYSYIRIFDPDQRKVIRNLKITKVYKNKVGETIKVPGFVISSDDKYIIHDKAENWLYIYNLDEDRELDYSFGVPGSIKIVDSTTIYSCNSGRGVYANKLDLSVGVDNQNNEIEEITVFPNPAGSFINLKLPENIIPKKWEIVDIRGNILLKNMSSISNDLRIDITQLAPEPYILRIYTDKTVLNYKIIKY